MVRNPRRDRDVLKEPLWHVDREKLYSLFSYAFLTVLALFTIFPVIYAVGLSLVGSEEWISRDKGYFIFPDHPRLYAYEKIFSNGSIIINSFFVSVERVVLAVSLCLSLSMLSGYIMSRKKMPGRGAIIMLLLVPIMFSGGLIPSYLVVYKIGIYNTIWALVIPGMIDVFAALVFKQFFEGVSPEIEESAVIDGATETRMMVSIFLPMSSSVVAALALFMAVANWNAWFDAMLYIQRKNLLPLQNILKQIYTSNEFLETQTSLMMMQSYKRFPVQALRMAITIVGIIPILVIYPLVQRHFVKGVYMGAVKG